MGGLVHIFFRSEVLHISHLASGAEPFEQLKASSDRINSRSWLIVFAASVELTALGLAPGLLRPGPLSPQRAPGDLPGLRVPAQPLCAALAATAVAKGPGDAVAYRRVGYYEVTIGNENEHEAVLPCISVGLCSPRFSRYAVARQQAGWDSESWALHSDDGLLFHASNRGYPFDRRLDVCRAVPPALALQTLWAVAFTKRRRRAAQVLKRLRKHLGRSSTR
eukprot:g16578.t1